VEGKTGEVIDIPDRNNAEEGSNG
ncbi:uncharacterized protein METZ01_LOCUS378839, partial [marine metagenome]